MMILGAIWVCAFVMDAELETVGHGDVESLFKFSRPYRHRRYRGSDAFYNKDGILQVSQQLLEVVCVGSDQTGCAGR